jgi:hypothetical protein
MTNTILIKRSAVANSVPASGNLQAGELAINYTDGNLFYKDSGGNVNVIASDKFVSVSGNVTANYFIGNGSQLTGISASAFSTITVTAQSNVVANNTGIVNFVPGDGVAITTDPTTGTVTFASTATASIFQTGGDMGLIIDAVTAAQDLGLITDAWTTAYDLGTLVIGGLIWPDQFKLPSYVVMGLPSPSIIGLMAFATNAAGGSIPVFSDGTNWRRVDDRSIVT